MLSIEQICYPLNGLKVCVIHLKDMLSIERICYPFEKLMLSIERICYPVKTEALQIQPQMIEGEGP
jgi:hypothetical protein